MNIKPEEITSIIKKEIEKYEKDIKTVDSGTIIPNWRWCFKSLWIR